MSQYIKGDTVIKYDIVGEGFPILFLHGWGMDRRVMTGCFEPVFQNAGMNYRRIYIDLPGMGKSVAGASIKTSDDMVAVLYEFAKDIVGEAFILAGESYGGYLARGFIKLHPEMASGVILLCPLVYPGARKGRVEKLNVVKRDDEFLNTLTAEEYGSFTYMNVILTESVWKLYSRDILPAIREQNRHFLDEVLDGAFSFDVDLLDKPYTKPCLIVVGKQDTEVGYKDQFELLKDYPSASYCAINNAGHNLQIEQPDFFCEIVKQWMISNFPT